MSPESVVPPEPHMGEIGRLSGVFFEPSGTFKDIAAKPSWVFPLALVILCALAVNLFYAQRVGFEKLIRDKVEQSSKMQQLPSDQRESIIEKRAKLAPIFGYVGVIAGVPIMALILAGILLGMCRLILDAPLSFLQVFAISRWASMPGVIYSLVIIAVMFLKKPEDFNIENPAMFNVGAFLNPDSTSKWLMSMASSIDLFTIWSMVLLGIGISAASRRTSFGSAFGGVVLLWAIYVIAKSAVAAVFA